MTGSPAGRPTCRSSPAARTPHPGAQLSLFEQHAGKRYQVIATNTPGTEIQFREAAHHTQARVEDRICCGKIPVWGIYPPGTTPDPPGTRPARGTGAHPTKRPHLN